MTFYQVQALESNSNADNNNRRILRRVTIVLVHLGVYYRPSYH